MDSKFVTYNEKCRFVHFRFRKDKDAKYLEFLDSCENKTEFLRSAIDRELEKAGKNYDDYLEITKKPTPEELKEGYREWTPENDRKMRERRAAEEGYVTLDGGSRSIELMKKLEIEDHEKGE